MHSLDALLRPKSVAVVGASPRRESLGFTTVANLLAFGYAGQIYPVHPTAREVAGLRCYSDLRELPDRPDCVAIALEADQAVKAASAASDLGIPAAVIYASGFAEAGAAGQARQREIARLCAETGIRICGPNCLGLANLGQRISLYSAELPESIGDGPLAVVSHSGSATILLSNIGRFGFSYLISSGNSAGVDVADYLEFLAQDHATRVVVLFLESIRDPAAFATAMDKMRRADKPVIALRVGGSRLGARASAAHTGALAGSEDAFADFFRRNGVIAVDDYDEMIECADLMVSGIRPKGTGLGVVCLSGGENVLTCDIADRLDIMLPELQPATIGKLTQFMPAFGRASNPLDVTGAAVFDMDFYRRCIEAVASDPGIDLVAISQDCPAAMGSKQAAIYSRIAGMIGATALELDKPLVLYSNAAGGGIHQSIAETLHKSGVPALRGTRASLLALRRLLDYVDHRQRPASLSTGPVLAVDASWHSRFASGGSLTERESKEFLRSCGVAVAAERFAETANAAVAAAQAIGYPVVVKIESPDLAHKSDAGGVRLGLETAAAVREAFAEVCAAVRVRAPSARINGVLVQKMIRGGIEVIAGFSRQQPFGPAIVFGAGGVFVELLHDSQMALAPIDAHRANAMIDSTRIGKVLNGYRGSAPADIDALIDLLLRLSDIAATYGDVIEALELNPVAVLDRGKGLQVIDALIIPRAMNTGAQPC